MLLHLSFFGEDSRFFWVDLELQFLCTPWEVRHRLLELVQRGGSQEHAISKSQI